MIKLLSVIFFMGLTSSIAMWFSYNDGNININWLGWQISTSISFFLISAFIILFIFWFSIIFIFRMIFLPSKIKKKLKIYQIRKSKNALYEGVIASSYKDKGLIKKNYRIAQKNLKESPLLLLLRLQNADLNGNEADSFKTLTKMLNYNVTRPLALKGIIKFANKKKDLELFSNMLNKSLENKIPVDSIIQECLSFCIKNDNWIYFSNFLKKLSGKKNTDIKNIEGLIDLHIAEDFFLKGNETEAKKYTIEAMKNRKNFPPLIELFCKLKLSKSRKNLIKILTDYCTEFPHPNIYKCLKYGLNSNDLKLTLSIMNTIFKKNKDSYIRYLISGKIKHKAKIWGEAKKDMLKSIEIRPSKTAYLCLAEIEQTFSHEDTKAAKWIKLSNKTNDDFKWTCNICHFSQSIWSVYCKNCKTFGSLYWQIKMPFKSDMHGSNITVI